MPETEKADIDRCPKCGSQTPIGHRCIVDDLDAIRNADLSDHPLTQAIKGVGPRTETTCICPVAPAYVEDEPQGLCLGVPGETNDCAACLALDPEEPCLHDPERDA